MSSYTPRGGGVTGYYVTVDFNNCTIASCTVTRWSEQLGPFTELVNLSPYAAGAGGAVYLYASNVTFRGGSKARRPPPAHDRSCYCLARIKLSHFPGADKKVSFHTVATQVTGNTAASGGGLYISGSGSSVVVTASNFSANSAASTNGGAIFASGIDSFTANANAAFVGNSAQTDGGALALVNVTNTSIVGASATGNQ